MSSSLRRFRAAEGLLAPGVLQCEGSVRCVRRKRGDAPPEPATTSASSAITSETGPYIHHSYSCSRRRSPAPRPGRLPPVPRRRTESRARARTPAATARPAPGRPTPRRRAARPPRRPERGCPSTSSYGAPMCRRAASRHALPPGPARRPTIKKERGSADAARRAFRSRCPQLPPPRPPAPLHRRRSRRLARVRYELHLRTVHPWAEWEVHRSRADDY